MMTINVKEVIGDEQTPSQDGAKLGYYLADALARKEASEVALDVSGLAPEDLVSSFVNSVFYTYEQETGERLTDLWKVSWLAKFPSEETRLELATKAFRQVVDAERREESRLRGTVSGPA